MVVMYATWRSTAAGLVAVIALAAVAGPALGRSEFLIAAGGASSGVLLGLVGRRARGPTAGAIILATLPLVAGLVTRSLLWERDLLRQRLAEIVELQSGDRLTAATREQLADLLLGLAPASEALFGWAVAFCCYALACRLFPRLGVRMRPLGRLAGLRWPFALVWTFALALALCVVGRGIGERWVFLAGLNLGVVMGAAFFLEGLAVGRFACEVQATPGPAQLAFALLTFLIPPMPFVVAGIGFFDLWFDFRRFLVPPAGGTGPNQGG